MSKYLLLLIIPLAGCNRIVDRCPEGSAIKEKTYRLINDTLTSDVRNATTGDNPSGSDIKAAHAWVEKQTAWVATLPESDAKACYAMWIDIRNTLLKRNEEVESINSAPVPQK